MLSADDLNSLFPTVYDGYQARKVTGHAAARRFEHFLTQKGVSFRMKIVRKPRIPSFFVFLLAKEA